MPPRTHTRTRLARATIALVAGCAVGLAAAFAWGDARTPTIELLRYVPFPAWLGPCLVALLLPVRVGAAWRLLALGALGLVLVQVMGLRWGGGDEGSGQLRLMTYNVEAHLARKAVGGTQQLAWELATHDPDVVVMQDAGFGGGDDAPLPPAIAAALRGHTIHRSGQYVVASRFPFRDCRDGDVSFRNESHHYLRCIVAAHGVEFDLVTAHLESPRDGLNATRRERLEGLDDWGRNFADRMIQAGALVRDLAGSARPMVVAGDLNAPQGSPVIGTLATMGLRDAFVAAGRGFGYTHGHSLRLGFSFLRIDHILVSGSIGVRDCFAGGAEASDHRPVIADLLLKRE